MGTTGGGEPELSRRVGVRAAHKLMARRRGTQTVWSGLGMIGLVGWSVVVPTLAGAALGVWLDQNVPMKHSWTLMLLFIGLIMGCVNAWYWVDKEDKETHEEPEQSDKEKL
ncbi:ATP synthase [Nitrosospira sp. NpAV]|nr:ATP synthase [Nitrosospira sp. NpAV]